MPCTREQLEEARADAFADDMTITDQMLSWSVDQATTFFEGGGKDIPGMIRILSLHGGGSNAKVNRSQVARLHRALGGPQAVSIDFFEGTRVAPDDIVDEQLKTMFGDGPYYEWYSFTADGYKLKEHPKGNDAARDPSVVFEYQGMVETIDRLERELASNGPYHAVLTFSREGYNVCLRFCAANAPTRTRRQIFFIRLL